MGSILRRLILILKAWLHAYLAPPVDPRTVFVAAHHRHRELLDKVRGAKREVEISSESLEAKTAAVRERLPRLEEQAREALGGGREELARFALQLRQVAVEELDNLEGQSNELDRQGRVLTLVEHRLATQMEAFFARQEVMAARYSTAEAHVQISEALGGVSQDLAELGDVLERVEQTSDDMEARVTAIDQLVQTGILELPGYSTPSSTASLTAGESAAAPVEDRLSELKRELEAE
jgi:phage shock protein A